MLWVDDQLSPLCFLFHYPFPSIRVRPVPFLKVAVLGEGLPRLKLDYDFSNCQLQGGSPLLPCLLCMINGSSIFVNKADP